MQKNSIFNQSTAAAIVAGLLSLGAADAAGPSARARTPSAKLAVIFRPNMDILRAPHATNMGQPRSYDL